MENSIELDRTAVPNDALNDTNQHPVKVIVVDESPFIKPLVKQLCLDCLRKSSIRGLPRILSSQEVHLKLLWTAAVLIFLSSLVYNLAMLTIAYRRGDVVITERPLRPRPDFPSVTVCDASALPLAAIDKLPLTPTEYRVKILRSAELLFNKSYNDGKGDSDEKTILLRELLNPKTYFDFMHRELANYIMQDQNDSIVLSDSCHAHAEIDGKHVIRPCARVRRTIVPGYLSCSTVDAGLPGEKINKLGFHVLLDSEENVLECRHCIPEHMETLRTGTIVFVHEQSLYPVSVDAGMYVTPGMQDSVLLKSKRIALASGCSDSYPRKLYFTLYGRTMSSDYDRELCFRLARNDIIRKICHCSATAYPDSLVNTFESTNQGTNASYGSSELPSCSAKVLSNSMDNFDGVKCVMKVDKLLQLGDGGVIPSTEDDASLLIDLNRQCPKPCRYLEFTTARSASRGASKNTALEIFRTLVANTSAHARLRHHLEPYEKAIQLKAQNRLTEARQLIENTDYLEQNFLTVIVWFPNKMSTMVIHQYIIGLASYLSQVGGLLSLFSGITVICIAEGLELILNIICGFRYGMSRQH